METADKQGVQFVWWKLRFSVKPSFYRLGRQLQIEDLLPKLLKNQMPNWQMMQWSSVLSLVEEKGYSLYIRLVLLTQIKQHKRRKIDMNAHGKSIVFTLWQKRKTTLKEGSRILEEKLKPTFQQCSGKKTSAAPPISPLGGFVETYSFSFVGQMEHFFQSHGRRNQNGGRLCFSDSDWALQNTKLINTSVIFPLDLC